MMLRSAPAIRIRLATLCCCLCLGSFAGAFSPSSARWFVSTSSPSPRQRLAVPTTSLDDDDANNDVLARSFCLSRDEVKPIIQFGKGDKEKLVNAWGLWCVAVTAVTSPLWAASMSLLNLLYKVNNEWDPDRALYDKTGKIWAKSWLSLCMSMPTFSGDVKQLKEGNGPCLYVANHASWIDIPILCTILDPVFKFIAKGELRDVPCIGQQLVGGHHILIDREDRRSQLKTFKDGITWLKKGVPLMAFPEGKRSKDGRLMEFKGGLFSMAAKTKVPIVPITISHAHAVMPCNALFPVQSGNGKLHIHVHKPIEATGRSEDDLVKLVRAAFLSTLPYEQRPELEGKTESIDIDSLEVTHSHVSVHSVQRHESDVSVQHHDISVQHHAVMPHFVELKLKNGANLDHQNQPVTEQIASDKKDDAGVTVKL